MDDSFGWFLKDCFFRFVPDFSISVLLQKSTDLKLVARLLSVWNARLHENVSTKVFFFLSPFVPFFSFLFIFLISPLRCTEYHRLHSPPIRNHEESEEENRCDFIMDESVTSDFYFQMAKMIDWKFKLRSISSANWCIGQQEWSFPHLKVFLLFVSSNLLQIFFLSSFSYPLLQSTKSLWLRPSSRWFMSVGISTTSTPPMPSYHPYRCVYNFNSEWILPLILSFPFLLLFYFFHLSPPRSTRSFAWSLRIACLPITLRCIDCTTTSSPRRGVIRTIAMQSHSQGEAIMQEDSPREFFSLNVKKFYLLPFSLFCKRMVFFCGCLCLIPSLSLSFFQFPRCELSWSAAAWHCVHGRCAGGLHR